MMQARSGMAALSGMAVLAFGGAILYKPGSPTIAAAGYPKPDQE
jgi:hypothetical protein